MTARVRFALLVLLLVLAAAVRSLIATRLDGFTIDEPYHINSGVSYIRTGDYRLNPEQPPLIKLWAGAFVAPMFRAPAPRAINGKIDERDFHEKAVFVDNDPDAVQRRTRIAMTLFHSLALIALAFALRRVTNDAIALGALLFLAIDPTVAAHMPVVMMDLGVALWSAVAILAAVAAFRWWKPLDVAFAAIALGLAFGAKHNGVVTGIAVAFFGAISIIRRGDVARAKRAAVVLAVLLGGVIVLWAQYGFRFYETKPGVETFNEPFAEKLAALHTGVFRTVLGKVEAAHLLPRSYLWGLADVLRAGVEGRAFPFAIFGRTFIGHTPWFYFLAEIAGKLPIGLLLLAIAGVVLACRAQPRDAMLGVAILGGCFLLTLMLSNSGYAGVRHALVLYPPLAIVAGIALANAWESRKPWALATAGAALLIAGIGALPEIRPWEFHNALAGGDQAYLQFDNEGCDLGQRTTEITQFYRANIARSGIPVYDEYGLLERYCERQHLNVRTWFDPIEVPGTRFEGWFILAATRFGSKTAWADMTPFRNTRPVARFGNVLIYRGSFDLPWMRAMNEFARSAMLLTTTKNPDIAQIESMLARAAQLDPTAYPIWVSLGNVRARRGDRDGAIKAFLEARRSVDPADPFLRMLDDHVAKLRTQPAENVARLKNPWAE